MACQAGRGPGRPSRHTDNEGRMNDVAELRTGEADRTTELDALVIGAGFGGLYQLLCLRDRLGLAVKALEAGGGVGGTWYWNRYPGARCDSESHVYWYTFSPELMREWEWSERYPGQAEILRYLNFVADRFDLKRDIVFNSRATSAHYDEAANRWRVRTAQGETFVAKFLVTAVGCLSTANVPNIPGLRDFKGDWYHTGQWPHDGVDFHGKRVGMIGTGSTGIQAAPVIAAQADHLTVFQRTANYSVPARNVPLTPASGWRIAKRSKHRRKSARRSTRRHGGAVACSSARRSRTCW
jgi:cation diffusion facilitator CzcD-associated flavoprotein CzcO